MTDPATILNELLDDELNSPLKFVSQAGPYLSAADVGLWSRLGQMIARHDRRAAELARLIQEQDAEPVSARPRREEQYLAFLSLEFLKPRLIEWKNQAILRHERALMLLGDSEPVIRGILARHLQQHREELDVIAGA